MRNIEFTEDRKLDNRQEAIDFSLIKFSYTLGDNKIKRRVLKFKRRSGYSLISNAHSISYDAIGEVQEWYSANTNARNPTWRLYTYTHKESSGLNLFNKELAKFKSEMLKTANRIPVTISSTKK